MRPRDLFGVVVIAITGCAGVTHVVPTGQGTYMVASHGTMGWSSGPAQKAKAFEEGDAFCKQSHKEMETISESDTGPGIFGKVSSGEVHFRCVTPKT